MRTYLSAKSAWIARHPGLEHAIVVPGHRTGRLADGATTTWTIAGPPAPGSPGYHVLWNAATLRRILAQERPDVIELGSVYTAPWLLRLARAGSRAALAGFMHMDVPGTVERVAARSLRWAAPLAARFAAAYVRRAYSACDTTIVPSPATRTAALRAGLPEPHVVPLGIDLERFRPQRRDPSWRAELSVHDDRPLGLYVGRLAGEKDLEVLIAALPELQRRTGMTVVFVGDGRLRPTLEALARAHPHQLRVLGFESDRDRLARAYASADVCFAPAPNETFGLAALEAAASGTRVVGAGSDALGGLLGEAAWGRTFVPGNPDSLVHAAVETLAIDPATASREARRAAEPYTWDRTFTRLFEIYRGLTG